MSSCRACGRPCPDGGRFCPYCGTTIHPTCAACGQENPGDATFCLRCGTSSERTEPGVFAAGARRRPAPMPIAHSRSAAAGTRSTNSSVRAAQARVPGARHAPRSHSRRRDREDRRPRRRGPRSLRREAQAMGRLGDHPNIVTVFDIGEEHGRPFIVSQLMAGGDVERLHADARRATVAAARTGLQIATRCRRGARRTHTRRASSTATSSPATSG